MKRALSTLLSPLLLCSFTSAALAQQPAASASASVQVPVIPPIPPGEDRHQFLPKGQSAPYDGYLFDGSTAVRWGNWLVLWKERYRIDMNEQRQVCGAQVQLGNDRLRIEQQRSTAVLTYYKDQLEAERKKNERPWYSSFEFGVGVGVVSTVVLVFVTGYALQHTD